MAGCRSLSAISRYGQIHPEVLAPLGLRRSPSVATLHRLLRRVSVAEVRTALAAFARHLAATRTGRPAVGVVAVDGKTLRGVWEGGEQLHVLHVFAHRSALALDQVAVGCALDETPAGPGLAGAGGRHLSGADDLDRRCALRRAGSVCGGGRGRTRLLLRLKKTKAPSTPTSPSSSPPSPAPPTPSR